MADALSSTDIGNIWNGKTKRLNTKISDCYFTNEPISTNGEQGRRLTLYKDQKALDVINVPKSGKISGGKEDDGNIFHLAIALSNNRSDGFIDYSIQPDSPKNIRRTYLDPLFCKPGENHRMRFFQQLTPYQGESDTSWQDGSKYYAGAIAG